MMIRSACAHGRISSYFYSLMAADALRPGHLTVISEFVRGGRVISRQTGHGSSPAPCFTSVIATLAAMAATSFTSAWRW